MAFDKHAIPTKLLWVDLEMTGLDPQTDGILEIAAEITDFDFKKLASYEAVIHQPDELLERANPWAKAQHAASGLTERVRKEGKPLLSVEQELLALVSEHFGDEPVVLAGNSIHTDRGFIRRWWPQLEAKLHYRMLDVTALKVYMQGKYGVEFKKQEAHRAYGDIQESMAEWCYYIDWLRTGRER